jgi:AcrR family transcriptional regulator
MPRRTPEDAADTRRAILAAARELFTERGYAGTATTEVVRRAGVTRGALYHHFTDKSDLFRAVFHDIERELDDYVMGEARREQDVWEAFRAGARASMTFIARPDYQRIAMVDAPAVLGHDEWHATDISIGLASMEVGLRALHDAGVIEVTPDRSLAILLFGALTEAGLAAARGDGDPDELFDAFCGLVTRLGAGAPVARPL